MYKIIIMESNYITEAFIYCKHQFDISNDFEEFSAKYFPNYELLEFKTPKILELGDSALLFHNGFIQIEPPFELMSFDDFLELHNDNELKDYPYFKELFIKLKKLGIEDVIFTLNRVNDKNSWDTNLPVITENNKHFKHTL